MFGMLRSRSRREDPYVIRVTDTSFMSKRLIVIPRNLSLDSVRVLYS